MSTQTIEREMTIVYIILLGIIFLFLSDIFLILRAIFTKNFKSIFTEKYSLSCLIITLIGVLCFAYGYLIESKFIQIKNIELHTSKLAKTSLRVVQISDLHCDSGPRNEEKLDEMINPLNPDIIVFTGDSVNKTNMIGNFKNTLTRLKARIGKFAVRGNIDVFYMYNVDIFSGTGFQEINGDSIEFKKDNERVCISGLNYREDKNLDKVLGKVPSNVFSIFLYHSPDLIERIGTRKVDLYLAGHTHGGQVRVPFYGAIITFSNYGKKYEMGEYKVGNTTLYVNRGIGMEGGNAPRVRFLSRPEITVFDIKPDMKPQNDM